MGSAPKPHLGVASSILATMRNLGMVLGITLAGAVLYAFVPASTLAKPDLSAADAAAFLAGMRYAFMAGAVATAVAAVTSGVRQSVSQGAPQHSHGA
ncbi:MAG: hypothetical protein M0Z94_02660 [Dehalococcoidales bacterium]|nr:hypothetical protein [Dehalococcoidales bacterium]